MAQLTPPQTSFRQAIKQRPLPLAYAALCIARELSYPNLDFAPYLAKLDTLAETAVQRTTPQDNIVRRADTICEYLFMEYDLQGNIDDYEDIGNCFLNHVLESKRGQPSTLTILFLTIAQKLNLPVYPVCFAGHAMAGMHYKGKPYFWDPFYVGTRLSSSKVENFVRDISQETGEIPAEWLLPAPPEALLSLLLNNIRLTTMENKQWPLAIQATHMLHTLEPENSLLFKDLGTLYTQVEKWHLTAYYLEKYLALNPEVTDKESISDFLKSVAETIHRLN